MVDGAVMGMKRADRIREEAARGMKEAVKMTEGNVTEMLETCRVILEVFKVPAITAKIQQSDNVVGVVKGLVGEAKIMPGVIKSLIVQESE